MSDEIKAFEYLPSDEELLANEQEMLRDSELKEIELAREKAKESALKKLAKLGLTEEEAKAVIGL